MNFKLKTQNFCKDTPILDAVQIQCHMNRGYPDVDLGGRQIQINARRCNPASFLQLIFYLLCVCSWLLESANRLPA